MKLSVVDIAPNKTALSSSAFMPLDRRRSLLQKVRSFEAFSEDNDPHGEHDFGAVDEAGERFFWKIDLYDRNMEFGSPDPADPAVTMRVLTVMRADEY